MKGKKTIIIFTESERAINATALKECLLGIDPTIIVIIIDVMELRNRALVDFVSTILTVNINIEKIEAKLKKRIAYTNIDKITEPDLTIKQTASYKNMENIILRYTPDLVINIGTGAVVEECAIRKKLGMGFKVITFVDDYVLNKNLIYEYVDAYLVENMAIKTDLVNSYVKEEKIFISDIPYMKVLKTKNKNAELVSSFNLESRLPTLLLVVAPNDKDEYKWQISTIAKYKTKYNIFVFVYENKEAISAATCQDLKVFTDINQLNSLYEITDILITCPYSALIEPAFFKGKLVALSKHNNMLEKKVFDFLCDKTIPCENEQRLIYFLDKYPRPDYEEKRKRGTKTIVNDPANVLKKFL